MALHPIRVVGTEISIDGEVEDLTFTAMGLLESHIEAFVLSSLSDLFDEHENLLIVGQQVTDDDGKRSDLVAIDNQGHLVLIEIKRDLESVKRRSEPLESQAIRYAASLATIKTPDELVDKMFSRYISKRKNLTTSTSTEVRSPRELAQKELTDFLKLNNINVSGFNARQRIILIASEFDEQTLSSSAWLIRNGVDLSCYTLSPCRVGTTTLLDFSRILPSETDEDFYVGISSTGTSLELDSGSKSVKGRTALPRMQKLFEWNIIKAGDRISMKNFENSVAIAIDPKVVEFNGVRMKYNDWALSIAGWSSISIYDWAVLDSAQKTLGELRSEKMKELGLLKGS